MKNTVYGITVAFDYQGKALSYYKTLNKAYEDYVKAVGSDKETKYDVLKNLLDENQLDSFSENIVYYFINTFFNICKSRNTSKERYKNY